MRTPKEIYDYESKRIDEYNDKLVVLLHQINNPLIEAQLQSLFKWYGNARAIKSKAYQEMKGIDLKNVSEQDLRDELQLRGYFTDNLWHINDVDRLYDVEQDDALYILNDALTNEWITEQIFSKIEDVASEQGFKTKE